MAWYVVETKRNQETVVEKGLLEQQYQVFLPMLGQRPRFPSYLFIGSERDWRPARYTRVVVSLLPIRRDPIPIPDKIVDVLRDFQCGDQVEVAALRGVISECRGDQVEVVFYLLGQQLKKWFDKGAVNHA